MRISEEEYQLLMKGKTKPKKKKKSKYNNKKTIVDGITFDSKKEANRYKELKLLEKANKIKLLQLQPKFELLPEFTYNGETIRAINYIADFLYVDMETGREIVEDVKGKKTRDYINKSKLFMHDYGERFDFIES